MIYMIQTEVLRAGTTSAAACTFDRKEDTKVGL